MCSTAATTQAEDDQPGADDRRGAQAVAEHVGPRAADQPVGEQDEQRAEHEHVAQPLGDQRADDRPRVGLRARGVSSTTRSASPARAGSTLLPR